MPLRKCRYFLVTVTILDLTNKQKTSPKVPNKKLPEPTVQVWKILIERVNPRMTGCTYKIHRKGIFSMRNGVKPPTFYFVKTAINSPH